MRRFATHPEFRAGFVEMLAPAAALTPFGMVCGIGAAAAGADAVSALAMSAIMFSGAAQVLAAQLLASGAPVAVVILTCFVAGLRFLMYSAAMAPHLRSLPPRSQRVLAFLMTDQVFAASIRRFDAQHPGHTARQGAMHFLGCGVALWGAWQLTNMAGYFAGHAVPASWQIDFAVPLCFIALVAPLLRSAPVVIAAAIGGVAVVALDALPMKLNLIAAGALGIVAGTLADLVRDRWRSR